MGREPMEAGRGPQDAGAREGSAEFCGGDASRLHPPAVLWASPPSPSTHQAPQAPPFPCHCGLW